MYESKYSVMKSLGISFILLGCEQIMSYLKTATNNNLKLIFWSHLLNK